MIIGIITLYILPATLCYFATRKWCIKNDIAPTGIDIFLMFCPIANIISGVVTFLMSLDFEKNEQIYRKFFRIK